MFIAFDLVVLGGNSGRRGFRVMIRKGVLSDDDTKGLRFNNHATSNRTRQDKSKIREPLFGVGSYRADSLSLSSKAGQSNGARYQSNKISIKYTGS